MLVSINQLAELTGKDRRTIKKRLELLPRDESGGGLMFDSAQALAELYAIDHAKSEDGELDLTKERARLAHHQANKTALEEQALSGTLIPRELVERMRADENSRARSRLLSLPGKAAADFANSGSINEAVAILRRYVHEALAELASDTDTGAGRAGDPPQLEESMGATAEPDGLAVGRPRKAAKPRGKRGAGKVAN